MITLQNIYGPSSDRLRILQFSFLSLLIQVPLVGLTPLRLFLLFFFSSPSLRQLHISIFSRGLCFVALVDEAKEEEKIPVRLFLLDRTCFFQNKI